MNAEQVAAIETIEAETERIADRARQDLRAVASRAIACGQDPVKAVRGRAGTLAAPMRY